MHETIIAKEIVNKAKEQGKVKSIVLEAGELANITGKELLYPLKTMVDWKVKIINVPAKVKCECGYEGKPKIIERKHEVVLFECPECGLVPEVLKGDQIILKEVEVE